MNLASEIEFYSELRLLDKARLLNLFMRSEEHTSELQLRVDLVCRLLLEKKKVHLPVSTVGRLGRLRMIAHVQLTNVRFYERRSWRREGAPAPCHAIAHQLTSCAHDKVDT